MLHKVTCWEVYQVLLTSHRFEKWVKFLYFLLFYSTTQATKCVHARENEKYNVHKCYQMSGKFMQIMNILDNCKSRFAFH